jgi:hypothetical protein
VAVDKSWDKLKLEELNRQKSLDDGYRAAVKGIPNQKPKDPWADVRSTPTIPASKKKQQ